MRTLERNLEVAWQAVTHELAHQLQHSLLEENAELRQQLAACQKTHAKSLYKWEQQYDELKKQHASSLPLSPQDPSSSSSISTVHPCAALGSPVSTTMEPNSHGTLSDSKKADSSNPSPAL